jgi:hypothetical protein
VELLIILSLVAVVVVLLVLVVITQHQQRVVLVEQHPQTVTQVQAFRILVAVVVVHRVELLGLVERTQVMVQPVWQYQLLQPLIVVAVVVAAVQTVLRENRWESDGGTEFSYFGVAPMECLIEGNFLTRHGTKQVNHVLAVCPTDIKAANIRFSRNKGWKPVVNTRKTLATA